LIHLKTDREIDEMKKAGAFAFELLDLAEKHIKPGISTKEINDIIHEHTLSKGAISAPLGYKGFPEACCISINEVVCHGIPHKKTKIRDGDIVNVDVTPIIGGYHGDTSRTFCVGNVSKTARELVECAKDSLDIAISVVQDGCRIGDIGAAIQEFAEGKGFSVVKEFVGHGIGKVFHEEPQIPHYGVSGRGPRLTKGMTFTIEPMINEGTWKTKVLKDGWTAITQDGKLSAQFEHTMAIRSDGTVDILTLP
jgi:methionyl aminopeptidase